jgi:hypothetical protein
MKKLEIKNFTKAVMNIVSDAFTIQYCTHDNEKYVLSIEAVHKSKERFEPNRNYKMAIHKIDRGGGNYQLWLWDMNLNKSYPMNIYKRDLQSISEFSKFLSNILGLANTDAFVGYSGNRI